MYLIKEIIYEILIPINHLFNLCIDKSIYPDNMKDAIIKPIYKNNNIQLITNYRPISLLPQVKYSKKSYIIDYQIVYIKII